MTPNGVITTYMSSISPIGVMTLAVTSSFPVTDLKALRDMVRQERQRRGLSQEELAGMLGYSRKWISDFERGNSDPPTSMVLRMLLLMSMPLALQRKDPATADGQPQTIMALSLSMDEADIGDDGL